MRTFGIGFLFKIFWQLSCKSLVTRELGRADCHWSAQILAKKGFASKILRRKELKSRAKVGEPGVGWAEVGWELRAVVDRAVMAPILNKSDC